MLVLALLCAAYATPPTGAQQKLMSGRFVVAETEEVLRVRWEGAVDRFAEGLPWAIRGLARRKMKKEFEVCEAYHTRLTGEEFHVQCEGHDALSRRLDNSEGPIVNDEGNTVDVVLALDGDRMVITFDGGGGGLVNTFAYDGDMLTVDLVVAAAELSEPLAWFVRYRRAAD